MKKIILSLIITVLLSFTTSAIDLTRLIFESAIETDRQQTYIWGSYTKKNPLITRNGYISYEVNPFITGRSKTHIDNYFNFVKEVGRARNKKVNKDIDKMIYYVIIGVETYTIIQNNKLSKIKGNPRIWTIAYSWEF